MGRRRTMRCWGLGIAVLVTGLSPVLAAANNKDDASEPQLPGKGLRLQEADQEATPLKPVRPRSESTQRQLDALGWYMTGRTWEIRGERRKALEAYRQA